MEIAKKRFLLIQWSIVGLVLVLLGGLWLASSVGTWPLRQALARWTVLSLQTAFILAVFLGLLAWQNIHTALSSVSHRT